MPKLDRVLSNAHLVQQLECARVQGASVTMPGSARLLINQLDANPVFGQPKRGKHSNRPGSHHQNFAYCFDFVRHNSSFAFVRFSCFIVDVRLLGHQLVEPVSATMIVLMQFHLIISGEQKLLRVLRGILNDLTGKFDEDLSFAPTNAVGPLR